MNAKEVTNLKWVHVSDWSELTETSLLDPSMVCKADVKIFMNERGDLGFGTGICDRNAAYNKALSGHSCQ